MVWQTRNFNMNNVDFRMLHNMHSTQMRLASHADTGSLHSEWLVFFWLGISNKKNRSIRSWSRVLLKLNWTNK